jgi:hypothetical protein
MMSNRAQVARAGATERRSSLVDPLRSGSSFYEVPDPYERGRQVKAEQEAQRERDAQREPKPTTDEAAESD